MRVLKWSAGRRGFRRRRVVACGTAFDRFGPGACPDTGLRRRIPSSISTSANVGMEVDAMGENIQKMNDMVFKLRGAWLPRSSRPRNISSAS